MKYDLLFSSIPFIHCDKVTLSRITETDISSLWEVLSDSQNFKYSASKVKTSKYEVASMITLFNSLFLERKAIVLGIFSNDSLNKLLGYLELSDIDKSSRSISIGFMLNRKYNGHGFATEAVLGIMGYLFEKIEINRMQAYILPSNIESERLLLRCGFKKEGVLREVFYWPDRGLVDQAVYSVLASEYKNINLPEAVSSEQDDPSRSIWD